MGEGKKDGRRDAMRCNVVRGGTGIDRLFFEMQDGWDIANLYIEKG